MSFFPIDSGYQPQVRANEKDHLFFGGTSYLGLNYNPSYLKLYQKGINIWGLNNGASRNNNIRLAIYEEAEEALAKDYLMEAAVTFSSGWLAAQVAVSTLSIKHEVIYINDVHPALMTYNQPILNLTDAVYQINQSQQNSFVLVSNSVNNIIPQVYDFLVLSQLNPTKKVVLLLDHSHGFGYLQKDWVAEIKKIEPYVTLIYCGSLAKGLSLDAGVILGPKIYIEAFKNSPVYNGASPCSPAILYTYLMSNQIRIEAKKALAENLSYLYSLLSPDDFYWVKELPIVLIKNKEIALKLIKKEVLFTSFPYPSKNSESINRLIITSAHQQTTLQKLLKML